MFAARLRDENAIHDQQTAAAAKPLNQSIRGVPPKTPAKTPFGHDKNNENAQQVIDKAGGKTAQPKRNAFVTPANPESRAPLGVKTTNGKALKTPALNLPQKGGKTPISNKPTSPRLRRSKIKVHETVEPAEDVLHKEPEEREIEYMPPRGIPLNDDPDDILPEPMNLEMLKGKNLTRGWCASMKEDTGEDSELSDFEEQYKEQYKKLEAEQMKKPTPANGRLAPRQISRNRGGPTVSRAPPTMRAQNAALALGSRQTTFNFAAPTVAARARQLGPPSSSASKTPAPALGTPRFAAAKAASNTTLGYSKGRAVSASARRSLSELHSRSHSIPKPLLSGNESGTRSTLDDLLALGALDIDVEDGDTNFFAPKGRLEGLVDDEDEGGVFQLDAIEEL